MSYATIMAEQHCPYDVVVDLNGRLVRLQVRRAGKRGQRQYGLDGFDALALVALDIRRVAYLRWEGQQHVQMPAPGTVAQPGGNGAVRRVRHDFDLLTFEAATA